MTNNFTTNATSLNLGMSMYNRVTTQFMHMLHIGLQVDRMYTQTIVDNNMLNYIIPLHTEMQNYHLKSPNVLC